VQARYYPFGASRVPIPSSPRTVEFLEVKVRNLQYKLAQMSNELRIHKAKLHAKSKVQRWVPVQLVQENTIHDGNLFGSAGLHELANMLNVTHRNITMLNLDGARIGDKGPKGLQNVKAVFQNSNCSDLSLARNQINAAGMKIVAKLLKKNKTIRWLNLAGNSFSDAGVKFLAEALKINKSVKYLDLSDNKIGGIGWRYLAEALCINDSLKTLVVAGNLINSDAMKFLAKAIKLNKRMTTLDLSRNECGDAPVKLLARALRCNYVIQTLRLQGNRISAKGAEYLSAAFSNLNTTNGSNKIKGGVSNGSTMKSMLQLELPEGAVEKRRNITNSTYKWVPSPCNSTSVNQNITTLDLKANVISNQGLQHLVKALKNNTSISTLDLSDNSLSDQGMKHLAELLSKNNFGKITLTKSNITVLALSGNFIGIKGMAILAAALQNNTSIQTLMMGGSLENMKQS